MPAVSFTQAEIRRAVKGVIDGGMTIGSVEIMKDGTIRILPITKEKAQPDQREPEKW
ncbi:hypothetical protein [Profundibacter sp.]